MTPLAHAVRFAMRCGIVSVAELANELECTQSAIYRAMKQLKDTDRTVTNTDRTVKSDRTELTVRSQTDRTVTNTDRTVTSQHTDSRAHAYKESSTKILSFLNTHTVVQPPTEQDPPPQVSVREGEEDFGHGVFVNCKTIRHRDFSISLPALEMRTCGRFRSQDVKAKATAHALQWAAEIENGKNWRQVVPGNIIGALAAGLMREQIAELSKPQHRESATEVLARRRARKQEAYNHD